MVGAGWGCFNNDGAAEYGFYNDMWAPTVAAGQSSQLIEINTKAQGGDPNRQAGIFQRALVQADATYQMSLQGMIRADDKDTSDPWRYRVYVGFDPTGGVNWQAVSDWRELPWDTYYPRTDPGPVQQLQYVGDGQRAGADSICADRAPLGHLVRGDRFRPGHHQPGGLARARPVRRTCTAFI